MSRPPLSALARPIDPRYPSNLAIAVITLAVLAGGTAWLVWRGLPWPTAVWEAIRAALAPFFAWALARELDPDHGRSALLGSGFALSLLWIASEPWLLPLFWLLVLLRVVNRSTGVPARWIDSLAVVGLSAWLAWSVHGSFLPVAGGALLLDGWMQPPHRRHRILGALSLVGGVAHVVASPARWPSVVPTPEVALPLLALLLAFTPAFVTSRELRSRGDHTDEPLVAARVRAAQIVGVAGAGLLAVTHGNSGVLALAPFWAALAGIAIHRLTQLVFVRRRPLALLLLLPLAVVLLRADRTPPARTHYQGREIAQTMHYSGASWLTRDSREREEEPRLLLEALGLEPGMIVADVGAGNGFYALKIAKRIGHEGRVLAVDIQPEMLEMLEQSARAAGLENIETILGDVADPRLPRDTLDLALLVDVYHELSHPVQMLRAIRGSLKPDGRMVLVEFRAEDPNVPIKPLHRMSKTQILREIPANGFELVEQYDGMPWQHVMFFRRASR